MLTAKNLTVQRGKKILLQEFNLTIKPGEILEITGANGVGKTSLLRTISSITPPANGEILIDALCTAYIPTNGGYRHELTAMQILSDFLDDCDSTILTRIDKFGLQEIKHKPLLSLSDGQKKRVMLATIEVKEKSLLIIDEPFNALDKQGLRLLLDLFLNICSKGGIVIIATHLPLKTIFENTRDTTEFDSLKIKSLEITPMEPKGWKFFNGAKYITAQGPIKVDQKNASNFHNEFARNLMREFQLVKFQFSDVSWPAILFLMIVSVIPIGATADSKSFMNIASGIFWVATLLVMISASNRLLQPEFNQGVIEQLIVKKRSLSIYCFTKAMIHWVLVGLPLSLLSLPLSMLYGLPGFAGLELAKSLAIGSLFISGILIFFSALGLMARQAQTVISLLSLPILIPLMIFGSAIVGSTLDGASVRNLYMLLTSMSLFCILTVPFICEKLIVLATE